MSVDFISFAQKVFYFLPVLFKIKQTIETNTQKMRLGLKKNISGDS